MSSRDDERRILLAEYGALCATHRALRPRIAGNVAHVAQQKRIPFSSEKGDYYRHDLFPTDAARHGLLDNKARIDLIYLRDMRVKADYSDDPVEHDEADAVAQIATALLKELLG